MKNRYGDEYNFEETSTGIYKITGDLKYWRFGGKEGQTGLDYKDLGFVDPSGGPFICIGYQLPDKKTVKRIFTDGDDIFFEAK